MLKKITVIILVLLCSATMVMAQTVMLEPRGVSPAQVKADTVGNPAYVGLFDRPFSGLANVGVETQMYLKGYKTSALSNPTWAVTQQPNGSAATVGTPVAVDTSTHIAVFTPDIMGTYVVEFSDGGETASLTINAAKYVGYEPGGCQFCHSDQTDDWKMTDHASMLTRALDAVPGARSGSYCLSCHTTGYDEYALNDGFDDFDFIYPDSVYPGQAANMVAQYPDAMHRANIQCESCHGPASAHNGATADAKMVSSLATSACAVCHDDDHYHVYPSQWAEAGHSNIPSYPGGSRTNCQGCHNGAQFIQFAEGEPITVQEHVDITCAVCHDPHKSFGDTGEEDNGRYQIRKIDATLANGEMVMDAGTGGLCMNCHQNRRDALTYTNGPRSHYGPHYAPQADILIGTNAVTFGKELPTSPHLASTQNSCVDCHMYEEGAHGEHDADHDLVTAGMHSFAMVSKKGYDNVAACSDCHGDVGESFDLKKFYMNGNADHDGDGTEEGLQVEVHGLMDILGGLLPDADPHADVDSTWTLTELKAAFNHRLIYYDHSYGIHNPAFTVSLLKVSIQALRNNAVEGEIVAIEDVPNDQGKKVRIIWDKFVDDGAVAVDPVETYIVKRLDGEDDWTGVGEYTAHGAKRYALEVPTMYDSTAQGAAMTTFKVVSVSQSGMIHESLPAMGYSVDNLVPHAPGALMALLSAGNVELTWEAPADPDINYYRIYRSTSEVFDANETTAIGTTTELMFVDMPTGAETYYYKIAAFDFSGNMGETTDPVNVTITSVAEAGTVPLKYELSQNYPNPFNPETTIKFSLVNAGHVSLEIFNSKGQIVTTLIERDMSAGNFNINFVANGLSSGVYFYRIKVTSNSGNGVEFQDMQKMILMK